MCPDWLDVSTGSLACKYTSPRPTLKLVQTLNSNSVFHSNVPVQATPFLLLNELLNHTQWYLLLSPPLYLPSSLFTSLLPSIPPLYLPSPLLTPSLPPFPPPYPLFTSLPPSLPPFSPPYPPSPLLTPSLPPFPPPYPLFTSLATSLLPFPPPYPLPPLYPPPPSLPPPYSPPPHYLHQSNIHVKTCPALSAKSRETIVPQASHIAVLQGSEQHHHVCYNNKHLLHAWCKQKLCPI